MGNMMRGVSTCNSLTSRDDSTVWKGSEDDLAIVLSDYPNSDISEPIFRIGEKLNIVTREAYWCKVRSLCTGKENLIPRNFVAKLYHGWLFEGVTRQKAEELLRLPGNRVGSFLVRESSTERGAYVLSVKHSTIRHYRISRLDNHWYYISPGLTFQCLEDMINYYSDFEHGLCCVLTSPCQSNQTVAPADAPPVVMRRHKKNDRIQPTSSGSNDAMLSYGVRNSMAAYLSFSGCEEAQSMKAGSRRKKSKSVYLLPENGPMNLDYRDI
ncbi:src like adaptor 1a [Corythoichthys intestinalis]|uniref:src like adaptor 1a n=1 Tax=Corythoichthys intestinalis TaxID=161448 RepID=UPI0025A5D42B|nr:src like adaptor 1a [Corythoichthys intestinalis]XP_057684595.1 src like adaptor 1a [Corythoichthys intestinalis]XP_061808324.1 src-like-adapter [Nerophis lumbriciformis]